MDSSQPLFLLFIFFDAPSLLHLRNLFFSYSSSSSSLVVRLFQSAAFNEEKDHVIVSDILSRRGLTAERDEKDGRLYTRRVSSRIARAQFFSFCCYCYNGLKEKDMEWGVDEKDTAARPECKKEKLWMFTIKAIAASAPKVSQIGKGSLKDL